MFTATPTVSKIVRIPLCNVDLKIMECWLSDDILLSDHDSILVLLLLVSWFMPRGDWFSNCFHPSAYQLRKICTHLAWNILRGSHKPSPHAFGQDRPERLFLAKARISIR